MRCGTVAHWCRERRRHRRPIGFGFSWSSLSRRWGGRRGRCKGIGLRGPRLRASTVSWRRCRCPGVRSALGWSATVPTTGCSTSALTARRVGSGRVASGGRGLLVLATHCAPLFSLT
jgi:hypothetical protein